MGDVIDRMQVKVEQVTSDLASGARKVEAKAGEVKGNMKDALGTAQDKVNEVKGDLASEAKKAEARSKIARGHMTIAFEDFKKYVRKTVAKVQAQLKK